MYFRTTDSLATVKLTLGGESGGVNGQLEVGHTFYQQYVYMSSVVDRNRQSIRQAKTVIMAPHASLLMPLSGCTGSVVHLCGLTGLTKSHLDLAIYSHICLECLDSAAEQLKGQLKWKNNPMILLHSQSYRMQNNNFYNLMMCCV